MSPTEFHSIELAKRLLESGMDTSTVALEVLRAYNVNASEIVEKASAEIQHESALCDSFIKGFNS